MPSEYIYALTDTRIACVVIMSSAVRITAFSFSLLVSLSPVQMSCVFYICKFRKLNSTVKTTAEARRLNQTSELTSASN